MSKQLVCGQQGEVRVRRLRESKSSLLIQVQRHLAVVALSTHDISSRNERRVSDAVFWLLGLGGAPFPNPAHLGFSLAGKSNNLELGWL